MGQLADSSKAHRYHLIWTMPVSFIVPNRSIWLFFTLFVNVYTTCIYPCMLHLEYNILSLWIFTWEYWCKIMHLKTSIFLLNDSVWECLSTFYDNFGHGMLRNPIIYVFCYWRRLVKVVVHVKSCIHATDINSESVRFKSYYSSHLYTMVLICMDCLNLWHIWQTFKKNRIASHKYFGVYLQLLLKIDTWEKKLCY